MQFAREVLHLVESPGGPVPPDVSMRSSPSKPHKVWCEKTWHNVIPTLEHWLAQVRDLKVVVISVNFVSVKIDVKMTYYPE